MEHVLGKEHRNGYDENDIYGCKLGSNLIQLPPTTIERMDGFNLFTQLIRPARIHSDAAMVLVMNNRFSKMKGNDIPPS